MINLPLSSSLIHILMAVMLFLMGWAFQKYVLKLLLQKLHSYLKNGNHDFEAILMEHSSPSIRQIAFSTFAFYIVNFAISFQPKQEAILINIYQTCLVWFIYTAFYRLLRFYAEHPDEWHLFNKEKITHALFPFLCRVGKVVFFLLSSTIVASIWEYNVNGLVAGLGIGGIALALGMKDILSNVFGGMAVVLDKPFSIGDWISTEDKRLEGIVEDINFRSTRIRTFDKAIIYIPNNLLSNQPIYNYTRRDKRRVKFKIGLHLNTPEDALKDLIANIKHTLKSHEGVLKDNISVYLDELTPTSLSILIIYFTDTSDFNESMEIKQDVNFMIRELIAESNLYLSPATHHIYNNAEI